jgi:hypothetical protein
LHSDRAARRDDVSLMCPKLDTSWMAGNRNRAIMEKPHIASSNWYNLAGQVKTDVVTDLGMQSSTVIALLGDEFSR